MSKCFILYSHFYDFTSGKFFIGGVQTYISNLIFVLLEVNVAPVVFQMGPTNETKQFDRYQVVQIKTKDEHGFRVLMKEILKVANPETDLLIIGTDGLVSSCKNPLKTIVIQHGISWDKPYRESRSESDASLLKHLLGRAQMAFQLEKRLAFADTVVCVDYNFINWYRSMFNHGTKKLFCIPNFSEIPNETVKDNRGKIKIIFARRMFWYRGTGLFTDALLEILPKYKNLEVTICGDGPDESSMEKKLMSFSTCVHFSKYASENSLKMHSDKDIAVIPTLGSEGTSLSLLEAMASGCACICSNVGGMSNVVLDHFNGLIINPYKKDLINALDELISNGDLRRRLSVNAHETVAESFSLSSWREKWSSLICGLLPESPKNEKCK